MSEMFVCVYSQNGRIKVVNIFAESEQEVEIKLAEYVANETKNNIRVPEVELLLIRHFMNVDVIK